MPSYNKVILIGNLTRDPELRYTPSGRAIAKLGLALNRSWKTETGETREEVAQVMDDLRAADVDFLTIGQYLQPTPKHAALDRFVTPDEFSSYAELAKGKGFLLVSSSPLTRSSYHAGEDFAQLRAARDAQLAAISVPAE